MIPNGDTLVDISGNGYNGTIINMISTNNGILSPGDDALITLATGFTLPLSGWTVVWRSKMSVIDATQTILGSSITATSRYIRYNTSGVDYIQVECNDSGNDSLAIINSHSTNEEDFVITCSNGILKGYQNGVEIGNFTAIVGDDMSVDRLLAHTDGSSAVFNGKVLDLRIFNYAFSEQEAIDYHNSFNRVTKKGNFTADFGVGDTI